jgi:hypothetical protein
MLLMVMLVMGKGVDGDVGDGERCRWESFLGLLK